MRERIGISEPTSKDKAAFKELVTEVQKRRWPHFSDKATPSFIAVVEEVFGSDFEAFVEVRNIDHELVNPPQFDEVAIVGRLVVERCWNGLVKVDDEGEYTTYLWKVYSREETFGTGTTLKAALAECAKLTKRALTHIAGIVEKETARLTEIKAKIDVFRTEQDNMSDAFGLLSVVVPSGSM